MADRFARCAEAAHQRPATSGADAISFARSRRCAASARIKASPVVACSFSSRARPAIVSPAASSPVPIQNSFVSRESLRSFVSRRFESARQASGKGQNRQQTEIVKPDLLGCGVQAPGVRREFEEKFVPRSSLAEGAQVKGLQGKIGLHDSGGQFVAPPGEQAIPIASDSKSLGNCLAADVRLAVPQRLEAGERGSEVAALREIERPEQAGSLEQSVGGMEETKAREPGARQQA